MEAYKYKCMYMYIYVYKYVPICIYMASTEKPVITEKLVVTEKSLKKVDKFIIDQKWCFSVTTNFSVITEKLVTGGDFALFRLFQA